MTEDEYHDLRDDVLYTFKFYNGIIKTGYLTENYEDDKYYIVRPTNENRNKPAKEVGFSVLLSQIETWNEVSQTSMQQAGTLIIRGTVQAKKLVILGAGASYDYTYADVNYIERPPLTNSLFDDHYTKILSKYNGAYDLSSEILLRKLSLEEYFQRQWEKIERTYDQHLLNKLVNTQYYIHELFFFISEQFSNNRKNNYLNLVKLAHEYTTHNPGEYIPIVTFNYDTLLEEALQRQLQYDYHQIDKYIDYGQHKLLVFKPHGSCNWVRRFKPGFAPISFIEQHVNSIDLMAKHIYANNKSLRAIHDHLENEISLYVKNPNPNSKFKQNSFYHNYYPWILIPYKNKDELIMPRNHQTLLRHSLNKVEEILIIGWRGSENVFQDFLKNSLGGRQLKITLVEPEEKNVAAFKETYKRILPNVTYTTINENRETCMTFTKFIESCHTNETHFFS